MLPRPKLRRSSRRRFSSGFSAVSSIQMNSAERDSGDQRQPHDEGRAEPVVLVAFLQHRLQRGKPDGQRRDAWPVAITQQPELHRCARQRRQQRRQHDRAGHQVDVEDVLPAVGFGEIAADRRADRRSEGGRQREHRHTHGLLRPRQHGQGDGEGERDQHAAEEALQRPQHDHLLKVPGKRTGDRHRQEQHRVRQQIAAQREHRRKEAGQRDDHDLRHQVGRRDPAAVIDAGADGALDIGQRRVGDLDVQHRNERADDGADDGEPDLRIGARLGRRRLMACSMAISLSACRWSARPTCRGAAARRAHCRRAARSSPECAARPW